VLHPSACEDRPPADRARFDARSHARRFPTDIAIVRFR
jgi:hypothetical protein